MNPIHYTSEQAHEYAAALTAADTREKLLAVLTAYRPLAADALAAAPQDDAEFEAWRAGLARERHGRFAGFGWSARWGALLMPELMLRISLVASDFRVPFGCAALQLKEAGRVVVRDDGVWVWREPR